MVKWHGIVMEFSVDFDQTVVDLWHEMTWNFRENPYHIFYRVDQLNKILKIIAIKKSSVAHQWGRKCCIKFDVLTEFLFLIFEDRDGTFSLVHSGQYCSVGFKYCTSCSGCWTSCLCFSWKRWWTRKLEKSFSLQNYLDFRLWKSLVYFELEHSKMNKIIHNLKIINSYVYTFPREKKDRDSHKSYTNRKRRSSLVRKPLLSRVIHTGIRSFPAPKPEKSKFFEVFLNMSCDTSYVV